MQLDKTANGFCYYIQAYDKKEIKHITNANTAVYSKRMTTELDMARQKNGFGS